jgi:phosphoribosylformylglycinamidine cyclo-ligase
MSSNSYKQSGVDVEAGDALVEWLAEDNKKSKHHQNRIVSGIGGFASLFDIRFPEMKEPLLVTCTDGVGTKIKLAASYNRYFSIAQDCVAMCVNDLICTGGQPLLFLDYFATSKLDLVKAQDFLSGLKFACEKSQCALVGGETAEMPGVYQDGDFDVAGFAVGVVDKAKRFGPHLVKKNDIVIGVSSSGFHSNGYSLLRKVFSSDIENWKDQLLIPTALYVELVQQLKEKCEIHAISHITGGGMENVPRVLPSDLKWNMKNWKFPEAFLEVQKRTNMSDQEMYNTLNCGIGLVLILPQQFGDEAIRIITNHNFDYYELGEMI